ncbi:MAG: hypothetical protein DYG86_03005 [Chloroflexi bacterium CFX2]|nr:hypothetical protein [Chloroflexi bacterium CFX2]
MMDMVKCPLCGTMNPPTQKICQGCQTPLSGESFQPGQAPVKKDTGELEPILPQWLRDARETAKESGLGERYQQSEPNQSAASSSDLLAGLQSQARSDDEEEVPDWLANITGAPKQKQKLEEPEEFTGVRWVETGHRDDFEQEDEVPSWLAGMQTPSTGADEKDELTEWFQESGPGKDTFKSPFQQIGNSGPSSSQPKPDDTTPEWLKQMAAEAGEKKTESESMDWFSQIPAESPAGSKDQSQEPSVPALGSDSSDWLSKLQADVNTDAQAKAPESSEFPADTPDWLRNLGGVSGGEPSPFIESTPDEPEPLIPEPGIPSWLASEESKRSDSTPVWLQEKGGTESDVPAWVSQDSASTADSQAQQDNLESPVEDIFSDLPEWLKSAAPESSIFDEPAKPVETQGIGAAEPTAQPAFETTPAFTDAGIPSDADGLFTEMPDWLSNALETPVTPGASEPGTGSDALASNVLPSWVEAMRPMDQAIPGSSSLMSDQTFEQRGALAGLQGVLPAGLGFAPTSKPKTYSNKLSVNDEQLKHAEIFEQVLAAETAPEMLVTERQIGASRGLRWAISAILIGVILTVTFLGTRFLSVPIGVPNELRFSMAVAQAIPENAPVLVVMDYDASRAGEMEAASAPLFDNLMLLKHPRLTFIASNEPGAILSERFITGPLAVHNYQSGVTYLNLGYLAGAQVGIRAFAENPMLAAPMEITGQPAWALPPLQDVKSLDQFALIVLITDDADAARSWIEQTETARGVVPIVAISSAQAAPMIQPYYDSGQVAGIISGLYGGAIVERQYNNGRPGLARNYWDAYSLGMLLALVFTLGGGFVQLGLGLRDRTASRGGK